MNLVFERRMESKNYEYANFAFSGVLFIFAVYFVINETRQLKVQRINYFTNIWNYIDLLAPLSVLTALAL